MLPIQNAGLPQPFPAEKKLPGKEWRHGANKGIEWSWTQDANLKAQGKWPFTRCLLHNVYTGEFGNTPSKTLYKHYQTKVPPFETDKE
jgi:hypothetical protein